NTKSGGRQDFDSRPSRFIFLAGSGAQGSSELRHDERISGAATGDNELVDLYFAPDEAMKGVDDGERGKESSGANQVVGLGAVLSPQCEKLLEIGAAIVFATGGLWGRELEVRIAEEFVNQGGERTALHGQLGILVVTPGA